MKILLTGASGFVGSHILDSLRARGLTTVLLLRPTSNKQFTLSDQTVKIAQNLKQDVSISYWDQPTQFQAAHDLLKHG